MSSRWLAVLSLTICAAAATRPHYGGVLRVEMREAFATADPPQTGAGMANLAGPFAITEWVGGRHAIYTADEGAAGGRPFLDSIEIQMARPLRDQSIDLELGRADIVQLGPNELRRQQAGRKVWTSMPVRIVALVFGARVEDARIREALSLAVDRAAIHLVLLQREGEISGALLPQWLSGYAFLFPGAADITRARTLAMAAPISSRALTLAVSDPAARPIADRIALNARDCRVDGKRDRARSLTPMCASWKHESPLLQIPARAHSPELRLSFGLGEPARGGSPEGIYSAERALLDGFHVIPLFHLPDVYGVKDPRVKGRTRNHAAWRMAVSRLVGGRRTSM